MYTLWAVVSVITCIVNISTGVFQRYIYGLDQHADPNQASQIWVIENLQRQGLQPPVLIWHLSNTWPLTATRIPANVFIINYKPTWCRASYGIVTCFFYVVLCFYHIMILGISLKSYNKGGERERERDGRTERQTDRAADRQDRQTNRQTNRQSQRDKEIYDINVSYILLWSSNLDGILHANHDDVIKWKHLPRNWPFVRGIHRSPVNSPHKGQWRGALMFSLICARINGWVNNREAGDLSRHRAHYDVIVMHTLLCIDLRTTTPCRTCVSVNWVRFG